MNKKKLLIYLTIILSMDSIIIFNINFYKFFSNLNGNYAKKELSIKLLSNYTIDSSWTVIDETVTATISLDDVISNYMSHGKTKFYIKDGTYNINNCINITSPNIIIYGESKEHTQIVQSNTGKNTIEVTSDYVQVSNLTINNTKGEIAFTSKNANNIILENCIIYGSPNNSAIAFWGTTGVNDIDAVENNNLTSNNIIQGNTIYSTLKSSSTSDGLIFTKQKNGTINNNTLIGSRIAFYLCRNSEVSFNTINDSKSNGIRVTVPAYDNKIINNTIDNTFASGILVVRNDADATPHEYRASNLQISNNTITNSRYFGIEISNLKDSTITNNTIKNVDFDGIYLLYSDNLNVNQNKIYNTGLATATNGRKLWDWNETLNSGIFLDYSVCNSTLNGNEITNLNNNCIYGIRIQSGGSNLTNSITSNAITGNFSIGINANTNLPEQTYINNNIINIIPTNLKASVDINDITLTWDPVVGATEYDIELNGQVVAQVSGTSYTNTGLAINTSYTYRVRALNGAWSNSLTTSTLPLTAPTNLTALADVDNITLAWDPVAGASEYDIELNGQTIAQASGTSYINNGLASNTNYTYRVRSVGNAWSDFLKTTTLPSPHSNTTTGSSVVITPTNPNTTTGASVVITPNKIPNSHKKQKATISYSSPQSSEIITPTIHDTTAKSLGTKLPAPTNIIIIASIDKIAISWDSVLGATSYEIEIDNHIVDNDTNTHYVSIDLKSNTTYKYRVRAIGGTWSNFVKVKTLSKSQPLNPNITLRPNLSDIPQSPEVKISSQETLPANLKQTHYLGKTTYKPIESSLIPTNITTIPQTNSITITWDAVLGVNDYEIEVDGELLDNGNNTSYVDTGLASSTYHSYRIKIKGMDWSELLTVRTLNENVISMDNIDENKDNNEINKNSNIINSIENFGLYKIIVIILTFSLIGIILLKKFLQR